MLCSHTSFLTNSVEVVKAVNMQGGYKAKLSGGVAKRDGEELKTTPIDRFSIATTTTNAVPRNDEKITECATIWSILGFVVTSSHTYLMVAFVVTGREVYTLFYSWLLMPICSMSMAISFLLKPRRTDVGYLSFLYIQYGVFNIAGVLLYLTGYNWAKDKVYVQATASVLYALILILLTKIRSKIAQLSDSDLTYFLSLTLVKGGLIAGVGQLLFLVFGALQCESEAVIEVNALDCRQIWNETLHCNFPCVNNFEKYTCNKTYCESVPEEKCGDANRVLGCSLDAVSNICPNLTQVGETRRCAITLNYASLRARKNNNGDPRKAKYKM